MREGRSRVDMRVDVLAESLMLDESEGQRTENGSRYISRYTGGLCDTLCRDLSKVIVNL
jgi:hypothetical protein